MSLNQKKDIIQEESGGQVTTNEAVYQSVKAPIVYDFLVLDSLLFGFIIKYVCISQYMHFIMEKGVLLLEDIKMLHRK